MPVKEDVVKDRKIQMVTFQLGHECYGIDIMDVLEIYAHQEVRPIPHAPDYVSGILNLRGEIIPIISLHKRFRVTPLEIDEEEDDMSGFVIFNIGKTKMGVIIDKILRVVTVEATTIVPPPQMLSVGGTEYIRGVVNQGEDGYLVVLDIGHLFDTKELIKLEGLHKGKENPASA